MSNNFVNLILIGVGPHAKRIYFPIYQRDGYKYRFRIVYGIDLEEKRNDIEGYLRARGNPSMKMFFVNNEHKNKEYLTSEIEQKLDEIVTRYNVKGVIIATEPMVHKKYAKWALKRSLSVLMDKPISVNKNLSTSEEAAKQLICDYEDLSNLYKEVKNKHKRTLFSVMTQRRYHPAFSKVKKLIGEVFEKTGCPITAIQISHADGQWRLPSELVDIEYHSFNQGYGKNTHSGYHFFDIINWWLKAAESREKKVDNVDIFTNFLRPTDFIEQINFKDYKKIFNYFDNFNKYGKSELEKRIREFGEIDAFSSFAFKHNNKTITLGSVNLMHNSFSQRGWVSTRGKDLYKGNGRVRHESYFIEQGPFQAISLLSYQSEEINPKKKGGIYNIGGEYHLDINVFRNKGVFSKWKSYEKYSLKDLTKRVLQNHSRGHQEDARRESVLEFISFLKGKKIDPVSELQDHKRGVKLLAGVYISAARRFNKKNPLVNVDF